MRSDDILIASLTTVEECDEAIEIIENSVSCHEGGIAAWTSGREVYMKKGAQNKIAAITRKSDKLYDALVKANPEMFGE